LEEYDVVVRTTIRKQRDKLLQLQSGDSWDLLSDIT
jgi:hypothetical protein